MILFNDIEIFLPGNENKTMRFFSMHIHIPISEFDLLLRFRILRIELFVMIISVIIIIHFNVYTHPFLMMLIAK